MVLDEYWQIGVRSHHSFLRSHLKHSTGRYPLELGFIIEHILEGELLAFAKLLVLFCETKLQLSPAKVQTGQDDGTNHRELKEVLAVENVLHWKSKLPELKSLKVEFESTSTTPWQYLKLLGAAGELLVIVDHLNGNRQFVVVYNVKRSFSLSVDEDVIDGNGCGAYLHLPEFFGLQLSAYYSLFILILKL